MLRRHFNDIGLHSNRMGLMADGGLFIIMSFLPDDGSSYICVIYATKKCIHVLQRYTLSFWDAVPNEDEKDHIDSTKHVHSVAAKSVSIGISDGIRVTYNPFALRKMGKICSGRFVSCQVCQSWRGMLTENNACDRLALSSHGDSLRTNVHGKDF